MDKENHFDVIVLGVGSMGVAACYYLASNGAKVLGLEQFDIPHKRGSHAGQSRIIRKAYFEHPDYVPLLEKAYHNWKHLEDITGEKVFYKTGLFYAGPKDHPIIHGVRYASASYKIPLDESFRFEESSISRVISLPDACDHILEPDAGFVTPEKAIRLFAMHAKESGADIKTGIKVLSWREYGSGFEVDTTAGKFYGKKLVITSGAWTAGLIPSLQVSLKVTKQVLAWVQPRYPGLVSLGNFPCWVMVDEELPGVFYGFPVLPKEEFEGPVGFKLAWHYPQAVCHPDEPDRGSLQDEEDRIKGFLHNYFPELYVSTIMLKTCLYTNSPDEHFIIDYLPGYEGRIAIAAGFSGHGFKFVPAVGEVLCEMVMKGSTDLPVGFLGLHRFGIA